MHRLALLYTIACAPKLCTNALLQEGLTGNMNVMNNALPNNLTWKILHNAKESGYAIGGFCV